MITITGLTDRQKLLMDLLWNCMTHEDVNTLIQALPIEDVRDARSLVWVATVESLEQELGLQEYKDAATMCIARARAGSC